MYKNEVNKRKYEKFYRDAYPDQRTDVLKYWN